MEQRHTRTRGAGHSARDHALAVLRARNGALALALLPAAVAVVLAVTGAGSPALLTGVAALAAAVLALGALTGLLIARARPAVTPTIEVPAHAAPALHRLIRELAHRMDVPVPGGIALAPDCDSWLEEPHGPAAAAADAPVLVIGSPFLWWLRVDELRALIAPVVAGTGPAAHPDIAAARRCVRAWDAMVGAAPPGTPFARQPARAFAGLVARTLLRLSAEHAAGMERGVALAAADRAQDVEPALRQAAQEQVALAYAGWDRLLTRVALPAWRIGRWPRRLDAGVVAALTELSRRDRLAEGYAARLDDRPACDLLEEPGAVDEAVSLLAARLYHGADTEHDPAHAPHDAGRDTAQAADHPGGHGSAAGRRTSAPATVRRPRHGVAGGWLPVDWAGYPEEVVDRIWRDRAARLFDALDAAETPTLACALQRLAEAAARDGTDALAARLGAAAARAEAAHASRVPLPGAAALPAPPPWQAPAGRDLLAEHVTAVVCCAAADTTGAAPGLDWLDGPVLLAGAGGPRDKDLSAPVRRLLDEGDPGPLRDWLAGAGVRPDKPVRLV
ncbi:hypothetical protein [Streptomyces sp. RFCAC02]|uniref:hypothetical protein n=1 Tax=Streptomyces sp. RFCAC02 TaxID=2499143 RepID=UPI00101F215E|nr:hypothetical protein [Streptomyces sp. RFCAC02]